MADQVPENNWTWRRPLIWILTISSLLLVVYIVLTLAKFGAASVEALQNIALAQTALNALITTLYIFGATQEYSKLLSAIIESWKGVKP